MSGLFEFPFMLHALEAGTAVAVLAAVVGWYMVLRRQSFAGHTLSVMAFPGASGAVLAGLPMSLGYYIACGAAALAIGAGPGGRTRSRRGENALTGTVQASGLALGFLFLSLDHQVLGGPETLLFGSFLGITQGQALTVVTLALGSLAVLAVVGRPLLFASVDRQVAQARGIPTRALDVGFLLILGITVAATSQITGALLVFALLVAPAATAQQLTLRPLPALLISVAVSVAVVWLGLGFAYYTVYPIGFYITSFAFGTYVLVRLTR